MAKNMSVARISQLKSANAGNAERHNERKNTDYSNMNVDLSMSEKNVHFKDPGEESYMDILRSKEEEGSVSTRGLRQDATLFDEMIIDVNTMYFEEHGGYEFAKEFYGEAYRFACEKYGEENIISAVMHADELNQAATEELGRPVYHYHLHVIAMPVVDKDILWSKRCKDESLRGTVKETIHQISHSKKWASTTPMKDEEGNLILRKNGEPKFIKSYSILQDELFDHMHEAGFSDIERGERGSTAEHLETTQFKIKKDLERFEEIEAKIENVKLDYKEHKKIFEMYSEIERAGKVGFTGKVTMSQDDFAKLKNLAEEGLASRGRIFDLKETISHLNRKYYDLADAYNRLEEKYDQLCEVCRPFIDALKHFPEKAKEFRENIKDLFDKKHEREELARKEQAMQRQLQRKHIYRDLER